MDNRVNMMDFKFVFKSMSKFYRPDNQYFMNLTSNLFSHVARYTQKEIISQNHKLQILPLLKF